MFYYEYLNNSINKILRSLDKEGMMKEKISKKTLFNIEIPVLQEYGDVSTNVAMVYSKKTDFKVNEFAEIIKLELLKDLVIDKINVVKPGFINIFFKNSFWQNQLKLVLENKDKTKKKNDKKINIEYVSANPTGLLHIGHARGAVLGDVISNLLDEEGYNIIREYYINDAGNQIKLLIDTIFFHLKNLNRKITKELPDQLYPGEYLYDISKIILSNNPNILNETDKFEKIRFESIKIILNDVKNDLNKLGVTHDIFTSEKEVTTDKAVKNVVSFLKENDLAYFGYQDPPKGIKEKNWKKTKQLLFKSKLISDDSDRALIKNNGQLTYFMSDIIYHKNKIERNFDTLLNIWGVDHSGYVARLKNAISFMYENKVNLEVKLTSLVNLIKNNKPIKMSKRKGTYITLREVLDEVGKDALRFMMVSRSSEKVIDFNFDLVKSKTKENPVFYVQYAHARCYSIQKLANETKKNVYKEIDFSLLNLKEEIVIMKNLASFSKILSISAQKYEPHRLCNFLYELSKNFHNYWSLGTSDKNKRILVEGNDNLSDARLSLTNGVKIIIKKGLRILSISAPDQM
jgi:arginyl-tRNA synthetase